MKDVEQYEAGDNEYHREHHAASTAVRVPVGAAAAENVRLSGKM